MRATSLVLSALLLFACSDADDEAAIAPATTGETRALQDARAMIEQHAASQAADTETAEGPEETGE